MEVEIGGLGAFNVVILVLYFFGTCVVMNWYFG